MGTPVDIYHVGAPRRIEGQFSKATMLCHATFSMGGGPREATIMSMTPVDDEAIEPEHLETILIGGILPPEFQDPHFIVRFYEQVCRLTVVRLRVAIAPANMCRAIGIAARAAPHQMLRASARMTLAR